MSHQHEDEAEEYAEISKYIEDLDIIDNQKISYAMSKLHELFDHMYKRNGRPNPLKFPEDSIEGALSVSVSLSIPPYTVYRHSEIRIPKISSISLHASLLHRENKDNPVQWFKTLDGFLNQVDNWYNYEMSLPIPEEN